MQERLKRIFWSKYSKYVTTASVEVLVIFIAAAIWWTKSSNNPQGVFWSAVNNALSTSQVTIESNQVQSGESQNQLIQIDLGHSPKILTLTTLSANKAVVQTEDINTPVAEYTKYVKIVTPKKSKTTGKPINFSSVIGVWSQTAEAPVTASSLPSNLGPIDLGLSLPFGNLSSSQKSQLLAQAQNNQLYNTNFNNLKKQKMGSRWVYVYHLSIQPLLYIRFMKTFGDDIGLHQLDQVDPNTYGGQPALKVTWTVDAYTRRLIEANFGSNHIEKYQGYGIPITASLPKQTISATKLQSRLSALLSQ